MVKGETVRRLHKSRRSVQKGKGKFIRKKQKGGLRKIKRRQRGRGKKLDYVKKILSSAKGKIGQVLRSKAVQDRVKSAALKGLSGLGKVYSAPKGHRKQVAKTEAKALGLDAIQSLRKHAHF